MVAIKNAIENIRTNKLRVAVAMVWIVLGITSVVVVSSIGNGIEERAKETSKQKEFRKTGIEFYPNYESEIDLSFYLPFTQQDIGIIEGMKEVESVAPLYGDSPGGNHGIGISYGDGNYEFTKSIEYKEGLEVKLHYGRMFSLDDLDRKTIVLDYTIASSLADGIAKNAIGKSVDVEGEPFEVIGVVEDKYKENPQGGYIEPESFLPKIALDDIEKKRSFGGPITGLDILIKEEYDANDVARDIQEKISEGKNEEYGHYSLLGGVDALFEVMSMKYTINKFTSILSNVSLMIGGIGIMNIMYMSVAERQREIGIRRAVGAEPKDILVQFLIETIIITILGGILGMVVGTIAACEVEKYIGIPAIPSIQVYIKAVVVSILTGVIFGSIPALKASKLDPIKAIQG